MSCDFAILSLENRLSNAEAGEFYSALCEGESVSVTPSSAIDAFYSELTARHPEIDDVPEEEVDDLEICPWSIAFDRSPGHLIICCVWSKADYVEALLTKLAEKHGLALYNPQKESILYPNGSNREKPWWKLW